MASITALIPSPALGGGGEEAAVTIVGGVVGNNEISDIDLVCHSDVAPFVYFN